MESGKVSLVVARPTLVVESPLLSVREDLAPLVVAAARLMTRHQVGTCRVPGPLVARCSFTKTTGVKYQEVRLILTAGDGDDAVGQLDATWELWFPATLQAALQIPQVVVLTVLVALGLEVAA